MGGDKGRTRKGRKNEGGAGVQGGTLGRDEQKKPPRVLLQAGKIAPGTKAAAAKQSKARIKEYDKKLKFEAIHRNTGMWNRGVRSL